MKKRNIKLFFIFILVIMIALSLFYLYQNRSELLGLNKEVEVPFVKGEEKEPDYSWAHRLFDANKEINADYIAQFRFESGLIDERVVRAEDYEEYLHTDFETLEYNINGTVFMDPNATLDSQNITLYGHNRSWWAPPLMFTKLHELEDEANYEANKYIDMVFENEIRRYVVAHVYNIAIDEDNAVSPVEEGMEYMFPYFDKEALEYYLERVSELEYYDTGVEIEDGDRFLTLQTCVSDANGVVSGVRFIVVAKEIEVLKTR